MSSRHATIQRPVARARSSPLLIEQGHTLATSIQFEKHAFRLSYYRQDLEENFSDFFVDLLIPNLRWTFMITLVLFIIKHVSSLTVYATVPAQQLESAEYLIAYGICGLALSVIFCLVAYWLTFHKAILLRFIRPINCVIFLLLGVFPIITANLLDKNILNHTSVAEFFLLLLVYGQFVHMRFLDSIVFGWMLFIYFVVAVGVANNQVNAGEPPNLSHILSLVLYSALGVLLFNVITYEREKALRVTFEVYFIKKQQTDQLLVEIDELKKKTVNLPDNAPPDAPLTKALKLLKQIEVAGDKTLPATLASQLKDVVGMLSSHKLFSPNMKSAVGDDEIGEWLDHMLGENPNATIRPDSHIRRQPLPDLKEKAGSMSTSTVASNVNPFWESAQNFMNLPNEVRLTLEDVLQLKDSWDFDVFKVSEITNGHPLLFLAHKIFVEENFLFEFKIKEETFLTFVNAIECGYRMENSYHNSIHAADVLHATYYFLKKGVKKDLFSSLEIMAALVAAMVHDYAHPGVNNNFLIKIEHPLALRYNDRSVLENYHVAESFKILKNPDMNFIANLTPQQHSLFRTIVMDGVLGTDVSHHFEYLSKFENRMAGGLTSDKLEKKEDILLVLTYVVKCADMSNPSRPSNLNRQWVDRVMEEFFEQGDLEKEKNFDVTMFYDRQKPNVAKCQTGFIDFLVRPMYAKFVNFAQSEAAKLTLDLMEDNYLYWKQAQQNPVLPSSPPLRTTIINDRKKSVINLNFMPKEGVEEIPLKSGK